MEDLFGHVPQSGELPNGPTDGAPRDWRTEMVPDPTDPELGMVPRVHTKESIRKRMLAILAKARGAETMPFTPRELQSHTGLYPFMAEWLEEGGEGDRLLAEFSAEIARLTAGEELAA